MSENKNHFQLSKEKKTSQIDRLFGFQTEKAELDGENLLGQRVVLPNFVEGDDKDKDIDATENEKQSRPDGVTWKKLNTPKFY